MMIINDDDENDDEVKMFIGSKMMMIEMVMMFIGRTRRAQTMCNRPRITHILTFK